MTTPLPSCLAASAAVARLALGITLDAPGGTDHPFLDGSAWKQPRGTVKDSCATFKPEDVERAKSNIRQ